MSNHEDATLDAILRSVERMGVINAQLVEDNAALIARAEKAEAEALNLHSQMQNDTFGWAVPKRWDAHDLAVPRLELRWLRAPSKEMTTYCFHTLVYRHLEGDVIAKPLSMTTCRGSDPVSFVSDDRIDTPFRDGQRALSDARQLKLPLYITTCDGDVAEVNIDTGAQLIIKRGKVT